MNASNKKKENNLIVSLKIKVITLLCVSLSHR